MKQREKMIPISSSESNANAYFSQPVDIGTAKSVADLFGVVKTFDKEIKFQSQT